MHTFCKQNNHKHILVLFINIQDSLKKKKRLPLSQSKRFVLQQLISYPHPAQTREAETRWERRSKDSVEKSNMLEIILFASYRHSSLKLKTSSLGMTNAILQTQSCIQKAQWETFIGVLSSATVRRCSSEVHSYIKEEMKQRKVI